MNIISVPAVQKDFLGTGAFSVCLLITSFIDKSFSQKESLQIILSYSGMVEAVGFH